MPKTPHIHLERDPKSVRTIPLLILMSERNWKRVIDQRNVFDTAELSLFMFTR